MTWKFRSNLIPQKARGKLDPSMWDSFEWIAEVKEDGDRRLAQFCENKVRFTGTPSKKHGQPVEKTGCLPHINGGAYLREIRVLSGTVLDGEVVAPVGAGESGGRSKYVTRIMGSDPAEAERKQIEFGWLYYVVFDCLFYRGMDVRDRTLNERQNLVDQILRSWGNSYVRRVDRVVGVGKKNFYKRIVEAGGEGVVLKNVRHTYGNKKLWVKVKHDATADVVLMGLKRGKGKYAGKIGAMIFGQWRDGKLWECGSCSGMEDSVRFALRVKDIGRVIKIKHYGREPTGRFRHPQFRGWREDKPAKDCVYYPEEV